MTDSDTHPAIRPGEWICGCGRIRCGSLLRCHRCGEPQRRRPQTATAVMLSGPSERVLGCDRAGCGQVRRVRHGRFCSDACRAADWKVRHGGAQRLLDFQRVTPAPATGEPYESARVWLLGRLQVGPVSTLELRCPPWRASQNPAQRVLELRNRQHDIRTVRVGRRTWYWLHVDGMPVGCVPREPGE